MPDSPSSAQTTFMSRAMIGITIAFLSGVSAQTLPLCLSGYTSFYNSLNQTPCQMAAALGGACDNGEYSVEPLLPGNLYLGPTRFDGNSCLCSTVFYSLLSACAYCQGHSYYGWSTFDVNCSITYNQVFSEPIPSSTRIPHYAYLDVVAGNNFNVAAAMSAGGLESTPVTQSTGSSTTTASGSTSILQTTGSSNMASSTSVPLDSNSTLTAWEIGVVVVAVVVFIGIVTVGIIVLRRRGTGIQYKAGGNIMLTNKQKGSGQLISQAQYSPLL